MDGIDVGLLRVRLGQPVKIVELVGHAWFPVIHRFPGGELLAQWSMMPDIHCPAYLAGASHSTDEGRTWSPMYSLNNWANQCLPRPDGSLLRLPYYVYPTPAGQRRSFATDRSIIHPGGRSELEPYGMRVEGFPKDLHVQATGAAAWNFTGNPLRREGGRWITQMYGWWADQYAPGVKLPLSDVILVESADEGRSWQYVSTVARHEDIPEVAEAQRNPGEQPPEGPCEACLVELEGGELLSIYRVGNYDRWPYHASRSRDGGRTWSRPERMDGVGRVEPSVARLQNGALVLSGGRPGIELWLADDKVGRAWRAVDVRAHHNRACEDENPSWRIDPKLTQTTSYTELVEIAPNRLLLIYDRVPLGWDPVPIDSKERNMIFVMEVNVDPG